MPSHSPTADNTAPASPSSSSSDGMPALEFVGFPAVDEEFPSSHGSHDSHIPFNPLTTTAAPFPSETTAQPNSSGSVSIVFTLNPGGSNTTGNSTASGVSTELGDEHVAHVASQGSFVPLGPGEATLSMATNDPSPYTTPQESFNTNAEQESSSLAGPIEGGNGNPLNANSHIPHPGGFHVSSGAYQTNSNQQTNVPTNPPPTSSALLLDLHDIHSAILAANEQFSAQADEMGPSTPLLTTNILNTAPMQALVATLAGQGLPGFGGGVNIWGPLNPVGRYRPATPPDFDAVSFVDSLEEVDIATIPAEDRRCPYCWLPFGQTDEDDDTFVPDLSDDIEVAAQLNALRELPFPECKPNNDPVKTPCGHIFGKGCLIESLEKSSTMCPICRRELSLLS